MTGDDEDDEAQADADIAAGRVVTFNKPAEALAWLSTDPKETP